MRRKKRDNARWARKALDTYGPACQICHRTDLPIEVDHLVPRAQQGPSEVGNAAIMCREHHRMKTDHELLIRPGWLWPMQVDWLAENGHVWWENGEVYGPRRQLFTAD